MTTNKQIDILWKAINKQGKYVEELEKEVAILKTNSHPPIFSKKMGEEFDQRLQYVEAFIENIQLIEKGDVN